MNFDVDPLDFGRYSPDTLRRVRPDIVALAELTRRNLHVLESALGIDALPPKHESKENKFRLELHEAHALADALRDDLDQAQGRIADLERRLAEIEDDEVDALYASVGLVASAHGIVVHAARRALLAHLHPDRSPGRERAAATAQFQKASAAFDKIVQLRC